MRPQVTPCGKAGIFTVEKAVTPTSPAATRPIRPAKIDQIDPGALHPLTLPPPTHPKPVTLTQDMEYQGRNVSMKSKGPAIKMIFSPMPIFWNFSIIWLLLILYSLCLPIFGFGAKASVNVPHLIRKGEYPLSANVLSADSSVKWLCVKCLCLCSFA